MTLWKSLKFKIERGKKWVSYTQACTCTQKGPNPPNLHLERKKYENNPKDLYLLWKQKYLTNHHGQDTEQHYVRAHKPSISYSLSYQLEAVTKYRLKAHSKEDIHTEYLIANSGRMRHEETLGFTY